MLPELPLTYDWVSHIMFAGIVQSLFISAVLIYKSRSSGQLPLLWGLLILFMGLTSADLYLCYTGLMQYSLNLNDSTEFIALLIPPLLYLITIRMLTKYDITWRHIWPHLIAPALYFMNMYFYWRQPITAKYNAYVNAYFPDLELISNASIGHQDPLGIKDRIDWWILISFVLYLGLTVKFITDHTDLKHLTKDIARYGKYDLIVKTLGTTLIFLIIFILVESFNDEDAGDYLIGILNTAITFSFSYFIISNSKMLDPNWIAEKYATSGISESEASQLYDRLKDYLSSQQFHDNPSANQATIATALATSKAYLSRAIKHSPYDNFNDLVNHHRIQIAKSSLAAGEHQQLTVEAIGIKAGFGSRSTFYAAFKKEVGMTPAAYVKKQ